MSESISQHTPIEGCNQGCRKYFDAEGNLLATVCAALELSQNPRFPGEGEVGERLAQICPLLRHRTQTPPAAESQSPLAA